MYRSPLGCKHVYRWADWRMKESECSIPSISRDTLQQWQQWQQWQYSTWYCHLMLPSLPPFFHHIWHCWYRFSLSCVCILYCVSWHDDVMVLSSSSLLLSPQSHTRDGVTHKEELVWQVAWSSSTCSWHAGRQWCQWRIPRDSPCPKPGVCQHIWRWVGSSTFSLFCYLFIIGVLHCLLFYLFYLSKPPLLLLFILYT